MHQKVQLADNLPVGDPGPLPPEIDGLDDHDLADLSWVDPSLNLGGFGFWPVTVSTPDHDPRSHEIGAVGPVSLDPESHSGTAEYEIVPRAFVEPIRVTKADFRRLLTPAEQMLVEIRSKEIDAMTPAEFIGNPMAQAFRVMMKAFEEPLEYIELNHGDTIFSVTNVMAPYLPLAEGRAERILAGLPPE